MTTRADFVIDPELHVRGEPKRDIGSAPGTRRTIRTLDDALGYAREHKHRDHGARKRAIHQLENARTREQMLDAVNAFRAWLEAEDLLFPNDSTERSARDQVAQGAQPRR
jgi:hypothetical protein